LADLGASTFQLEEEERGFGFRGPLDMRMDKRQQLTAADIVNKWQEYELSKLLFDFGERKFARQIARAIVKARQRKKIERGEELLEILKRVMPPKFRFSREHHWATPTFRALRMAVNDEQNSLKKFLADAPQCLSRGGRLVVLSFHSLEDRIVKHSLKKAAEEGNIRLITKKPLTATEEEIAINPKARMAKMRVAEKL